MWFSYGREEGLPTQYPPNRNNPVTVDILDSGLVLAFLILAICLYTIMIGFRGQQLIAVFVRITCSLLMGASIVLGNFGHEWEMAHIRTNTTYKANTGQEIEANIGLKIGLRGINVTLKADSLLQHEIIDYNERFEWTWDQGRFGFGPYAGLLQRSFRAAQYRGCPLPILWVVDYFVFDGEGLRFGRFYRTAGWYTHIVLWTAFFCWILANILFRSVIRYGASFLLLAGALQLIACFLWTIIKNPIELSIPFPDDTLKLKFGTSFYITLIGGLLCCICGAITYSFNLFWPFEAAAFFGIDPLIDYDEYHLSPDELKMLRKKKTNTDVLQMEQLTQRPILEEETDDKHDDIVVFKRRSTARFGRRHIYANSNQNQSEEIPIYSNVPMETVKEDILLQPTTSHQRKKAPPLPPKRFNS